MKIFLLSAFASLALIVPLRAQTPKPKPTGDYVVVILDSEHPKLVPYVASMTILVAITSAGDFNEFGDIRHVLLIRGGKKENIDLKSLRRDPAKDLVLEPWDILYYPPVMF